MEELEELFKNYNKLLTDEERKLIHDYTFNLYKNINFDLRCGHIQQDCFILDKALDKFRLNKFIRVYRKLKVFNLNVFKELLEDGYILDQGYQSSSLSRSGFLVRGNVLMEIDVLNLNCGAYIGPISYYVGEREFLIKRDTRIDVKSIKEEEDLLVVKGYIK